MLNSNFCKMFKDRLKLRKVATIFACLVVTTIIAACDNKNGDEDDENNSPIVGMWRSELAGGSAGTTVGVVFFHADGSYNSITYIRDRFVGAKGKYKLNSNTLEVYDISFFERHDNALSHEHASISFYTERWNIIDKGTRSEVLAIIDPQHSVWQHYGGIIGQVGWLMREPDSWSETLEWIDANTIDYINGLRNPLKRVR